MRFLDRKLALQIEQAEAEAIAAYGIAAAGLYPDLGETVLTAPGASAVFTGAGSPMTQAVGLGMVEAATPELFDRLESFYARRTGAFELRVCPFADSTVLELCNARAYRAGFFEHCWVSDLVRAAPAPLAFAGVSVVEVGPDTRDVWASTVARGFENTDEASESALQMVMPFAVSGHAKCFLALVDGKPAGGAAMSIQNGVALLFTAATLPAYRKRGAQSALLAARLAEGRAAGCDIASVTTVPGSDSARNVERWGFRLAYTRLSVMGG